jgi:hypothetical protein
MTVFLPGAIGVVGLTIVLAIRLASPDEAINGYELVLNGLSMFLLGYTFAFLSKAKLRNKNETDTVITKSKSHE